MATCLKMTNAESTQVSIQLLLYKMTACLMWTTTPFLSPKWKKICLKQPQQSGTQQKMGNKQATKLKKWMSLWLYLLYCDFIKQSLMSVKTEWFKKLYKIIKLCKIIEDNLFFVWFCFFHYRQNRLFRNTVKHLWWGFLAKKVNS